MKGGNIMGMGRTPNLEPIPNTPLLKTFREVRGMPIDPSRKPGFYTIKAGDTLRNIVINQYGLNANNRNQVAKYMKSVLEANRLESPNNIRSGQELLIYRFIEGV
jgi:nucleoid-associated protein YgaU